MSLLIWLIVGIIAGWLAGLVMKGSGYGLLGDLLLGLVGGLVGGWLFGLILPAAEPTGIIGAIVVSAVGAIVLVALSRLISGRPVRA